MYFQLSEPSPPCLSLFPNTGLQRRIHLRHVLLICVGLCSYVLLLLPWCQYIACSWKIIPWWECMTFSWDCLLLQQQHKDISITTESVAYQYTEQDPVDRSDWRGSEEGEGSAQPVWTQIGSNWAWSSSNRNKQWHRHSPSWSWNKPRGGWCHNSSANGCHYRRTWWRWIRVLCDDTDVFVLLLHFYSLMKTSCPLIMESFFKDRQCIDIKATVTKHKDIIPHILAAHALSGCDTVAARC